MIRLGRLDHNPLARPAPITLGWRPREQPVLPQSTKRTTTPGGNGRATMIAADWPEVLRVLVKRGGLSLSEIGRRCGRTQTSASKWFHGHAVPGPGPAEVICALWADKIGGPMP